MSGAVARLPRRARAAIGVAALVVLAGAVALALHIRASQARAASIQSLLQHADREIGQGFYRIASQDVRKTAPLAQTRSTWLSIARRAVEIGRGSRDFSLLREIGREAVKSLPGSEDLWAILVYAELESGNYAEAYRFADGHLASSRFASFKSEALLRAYPDLNPDLAAKGQNRVLIETILSRDPTLFETLAHELNNQDLSFDAVLLHAWRGEMDQAYSLLVSLQSDRHLAAGMLLSYDAGHLDAALNYLSSMQNGERTPELELLADDILVRQEEYDKAAAGYERLIRDDPALSWTPYVDLAWLVASGKSKLVSPGAVLGLLQSARAYFPSQPEVVLAYARLADSLGQTRAATEALSSFLSTSPGNLDASLLKAELAGRSSNPVGFESTLWQLFYEAHGADQARVARYLGWYLLGLHDLAGLEQLFAQSRTAKGDEWLPFYRGIFDGLNGRYAAGLRELERAYAITPRWQTLYDMGVLALKNGDARGAEQDFQRADSSFTLADESNVRSPERATILAGLAEALAQNGDLAGARRELLYARDIDPGSLRVNLELQKLDSAGQK